MENITYKLPSLYIIAKNGRKRVMNIWCEENILYSSSGFINSKLVLNKREISANKREKNAEENAKLNAQKKWNTYIDKGYRPDKNDKKGQKLLSEVMEIKMRDGNVNTNVGKKNSNKKESKFNYSGPTKIPMLCTKWEYEDRCYKYFNFDKGIFIQPKLDGIRVLAFLHNNKVILTSRFAKVIPHLEHIRDELLEIFKYFPDIVFDGELYSHNIYDENGKLLPVNEKFSAIQSCCKPNRTNPHELENQIQFHIFDIFDLEEKQKVRFQILDNIISEFDSNIVVKVPTFKIYRIDEIRTYMNKFLQDGCEGCIIRDSQMKYIPKKYKNGIRKLKDFQDAEFTIVDIKLNKGVPNEHFVWVLKTKDEKLFKATPQGTKEQRLKMFNNYTKYIGKPALVKFQEMTSENVPRFGTVVCIRKEFCQ